MNSTDIIMDLNTAKRVLCVPEMLNDEMRIKIGQVITNAINYIEEREKFRQLYCVYYTKT